MKNNFSAIRFQGLEKTRGKVPSLGKNSARFSKPWKISARLFPRLGILALLVFQSLETPAATNAPLPAVIGPYLQNPASDGMTVCLLAQGAQRVRVAWGAADAAALTETAATGTVLAGTPWTVWKARLGGLAAGRGYRYAARYQLAGGSATTAVHRFHTLNPKSSAVRLAAFNDLHDNLATLGALMQHVQPADFELSLLLGDCWADPSNVKGADKVARTLAGYIQLLNAAEKPLLLVRGNHETRGTFAGQLAKLFDLPLLDAAQPADDQQWPFTLRAGPVFLLALDTGEDEGFATAENSYKRPKFWQAYRQREAAWLQKLLATQPAGDAAWRVFASHIPLYNDNWAFSDPALRYWEPLLPAFRPHLMLAGHDHDWKLLPKGQSHLLKRKKNGGEETRTLTPPWPVLIGGGPALKQGTVMLLAADEKNLRVRLLAAADGRLLAEFSDTRKTP